MILIGFTVFLLSLLLTRLVLHYALKKSILDIPNERSSHQFPTPRGGGIGFVCIFLGSLFIFNDLKIIPHSLFLALFGGSLIALTGYLDDIFSLKIYWRLLTHLIAAIWAVYWLKGFSLSLGAMTVFFIVWCINFYNFMDGIDGLAGIQGIFIASSGAFLLSFSGHPSIASLLWILAASLAGFTYWNWSPAKIFMGDSGSGFLGYIFSVFAIYTSNQHLLPFSAWLILLAIFILDATFTLLYRMVHKRKWYAAHREHAYQKLVQSGKSHAHVSTLITLTNCLLLFPLTLILFYFPNLSIFILTVMFITFWTIWYAIS